MVANSPAQVSPDQYDSEKAEAQLQQLATESKADTDIDLEFLYTRDVEFRQETIYFIVVDRFYDGDPDNSEGPNPELYDSAGEDWGKYWGGDIQGVIENLD